MSCAASAGSSEQADVLDFLGSGAAFGGERPRRIDTHAASLFLVGDRAWKLKRAVRLTYLDFSTAERRRAALARELELNRRTAADLYLGIHAVTRAPSGQLTIDGVGAPIDWLLEMRRFPDTALLADMANRGALGERVLVCLADRIAAFHAAIAPQSCDDAAVRFRSVVSSNLTALSAVTGELEEARIRQLGIALHAELDRATPLLDERGRTGRVRLAHGDLHLENIALIDGEPVPFDCLEFDDALATVDFLYDLAFLILDLWQRGLRAAANLVLNRYLDLTPGEERGLALLPLFLSVRAAIRAHVLATQARAADDTRKALGARRHLELAIALLDWPPPRLVAIGGLSGTGKSSLARRVAADVGRAPGARILRSDVLRKRAAGLPPEAVLPAAAYTPASSEAVYREMGNLADDTLAGGHSVIAEAVFARREQRLAIASTAAARGSGFTGLWLDAPLARRVARVSARQKDASDADASVVRAQDAYVVGELDDWARLDASRNLAEVTQAALERLGR